eukprot:313236-Alexandrium_andersonii.AAC.1
MASAEHNMGITQQAWSASFGQRPLSAQVRDVDACTASAAKHIRIECPGAQEEDITIEEPRRLLRQVTTARSLSQLQSTSY